MQEQLIHKTALVLEGGGFRGIFTAGVLDVLLKNKLYFNYAIGISAGATYGLSYASRQEGRNLKVNNYISDKRYSSISNLLKSGSLFSWDYVLGEIPENIVPFDYTAFANSQTQFWAGISNCVTGKCEYLPLNKTNKNDFKSILTATCSLPFIAPIVNFNENQYLDGGLTDSIPFEHALAQGNDRAIVILTRPKEYIKKTVKQTWFIKWYYRKHPKIAEMLLSRANHYNQSVKKLEELEKQGVVFVIRPEKEIEVSRLENNPQKTEKAYYKAMEYTNQIIPSLEQWLNK